MIKRIFGIHDKTKKHGNKFNNRRLSSQFTLLQQKLEKENQHILDQIKKKNQQYTIQRKLLVFDETEQNVLDKFEEEHKLTILKLKEKQKNILYQIEKEHKRILRTKEQNILKFHQIKEEKQQYLHQRVVEQRKIRRSDISRQIEEEYCSKNKFEIILHNLEEKQECFPQEKEQELIKLYKIDEIYQERLLQRALRQRKDKRLYFSRQLESSEQVKKEIIISNEQKESNISRDKEQQLIILYQINEEYLNLLFQRALKQREQKRLHISNQLAEENKFIIQQCEKKQQRILEQDLLKVHQIEKENQQLLLKRVLFQRLERQKRLEIQFEEDRQYNLQKNKIQSKQVAYIQIEYLFKRRKRQ